MKKLTSDHPLKEVIKECQNNIRDGFLTPLTDVQFYFIIEIFC